MKYNRFFHENGSFLQENGFIISLVLKSHPWQLHQE